MTKLEAVEDALDSLNVFTGKLNETAMNMTKVLSDEIPFHMSMTIANYTMSSFVGHFHYKIKMEADNLVPPNMIAFVLARSGAKKTSSMLTLEKTLKCGYEILENHRKEKERKLAEEHGVEPRVLNPLSNSLATEAGMIQRLNDFKDEGLGLPSMFVDEISTELATNPDMIPNIKLVSQLFDVGEMKSKPLKDREMQSEEVVGMGMTALFMGSEHGILEDETILRRFETEFISKLSRRCFFVYPEFKDKVEDVSGVDEILMELDSKHDSRQKYMTEINKISTQVTLNSIEEDINIIDIDEDARRLYKIYSIYCEEKAKKIVDEALNLEMQHRHWKAFKLAGVYAVFNAVGREDEHASITVEDLKEAINTAELTSMDLDKFIKKAKRETYEIMVEHFLQGGEELTVHEMIKLQWIKKQSNLKDMIINANSKLGIHGKIEQFGDRVMFDVYEQLDVTESIKASFKKLEPMKTDYYVEQGMEFADAKKKAKDERGWQIRDGFKYKETTFEKLSKLLSNDCAYTPFEFKNGIRGKDNVLSGAQFIVLDIDDDGVTIDEAYDLLQDYKFLMARSSDANNPYKFRVILPLDVTIDIERGKWKLFMKQVSEHLGLEIDLLPQSQVYYGFANREVLINEDGELLEASEIVKQIVNPPQKISLLPRKMLNLKWKDRMNEFAYAYNIKSGGGLHLSLFKAMKHAYDLGFSYEENIGLLDDIMDYIEDEPREGFRESLKSQRDQTYNIEED